MKKISIRVAGQANTGKSTIIDIINKALLANGLQATVFDPDSQFIAQRTESQQSAACCGIALSTDIELEAVQLSRSSVAPPFKPMGPIASITNDDLSAAINRVREEFQRMTAMPESSFRMLALPVQPPAKHVVIGPIKDGQMLTRPGDMRVAETGHLEVAVAQDTRGLHNTGTTRMAALVEARAMTTEQLAAELGGFGDLPKCGCGAHSMGHNYPHADYCALYVSRK